jgi:TonB family protein
MFEQNLSGRLHHLEAREALLAVLSLFFHAAGIVSLLAASWLSLTPIPLPKLHPYLVQPVFLTGGSAPAPKLGGGAQPAATRAPEAERSRSAAEPVKEKLTQPELVPRQEPATDAAPAAPASADSRDDAPPGPGAPDGSPNGSVNGIPGGDCLGDGCNPGGGVGGPGGPGSGGTADSSLIYFPGVQQVTEPTLIDSTKVLPIYPLIARHAGLEGRVILQAVIDARGQVEDVTVLKESPPHLGFGDAAALAVSRWRYRPSTLRDVPVAVQLTITVDFTLSR